MASLRVGEEVEIVVGGRDSSAWAFDGCKGIVKNVSWNGKVMMATVEIKEGMSRKGKRSFDVACLKRLEAKA